MKRSFYPNIEGFRGVSVFLVLISHWVIMIYFPSFVFLKLGFLGVHFFFVLSGFLITEILLIEINDRERPIDIIKNFFAKRSLRIFPIYYLTIITLTVFNIGNSLEVLPWTLTYTFNIGENWFGANENMFMHLWSLCVEEQFYLIWPFLLLVTVKTKYFHVIVGAIVLSIFFNLIIYFLDYDNANKVIHSNLISTMDALAVGALLAYFKCYKKLIWLQISKIPTYVILILLIVFWGISFFSNDLISSVFLRLLSALIGALIIVNAVTQKSNVISSVLGTKPIKFIGRISYGVYLYHWIISTLLFDFFNQLWERLDFYMLGSLSIIEYHKYLGSFSFFLVVTLIVATISFYMIEKPILKLKRYF